MKSRLGLIVIVFAIAAGALTGLFVLHGYAQTFAELQLILLRMEVHMNRLNSLEWQAMAEAEINPESAEEIDLRFGSVDEELRAVARLGLPRESQQAIAAKSSAYKQAMREEFRLIKAGKLEEAREVDETQVDPTFAAIEAIVKELSLSSRAKEVLATRIANWGAALILLLAAGAIAFFVWRFENIRRKGEVAEIEQRALRQSEERFRALFRHSSDVTAILGPAGQFLYASESASQILGALPERMAGGLIDSYAHPDDVPMLRKILADGLSQGAGTLIGRFRWRHSERGWIHVEAIFTNQMLTPGVEGLLVNLRDVTDRKRAEAQILLQAAALESAANAIVIANRDGLITWVNPAFTRLTGFTPEEAIGQNPRILKSGHHDAEFYQQMWQTLISGKVWRGEIINKRKDGALYNEEMTITPVRDAAGAVHHFIAVKQDVTERLQTEVQLRKAHEEIARLARHLEMTLDCAGDGIFSLNLEGRSTGLNPLAAKLLGWEAAELKGQPMHAAIHHSRPDGSPYPLQECRICQAFRDGTTQSADNEVFWRKDGTPFPVEYISNPTRNEAGKLTGAVVIFRDITERKRTQDELKKALAQAEEATRAKSEFLARMSHEIRTPLNGVIGMTELALETPLTPEQREYLETAKSSADALLQVINDILDFSKIEARRLELEAIPFRLRDTLEDMIATLALRAQQKGLELACDIAPAVPDALVGDPGRLRQILVNLLGNAIKFTVRGEVVLRVECESEADGETALRFAVRDTGVGIPPGKHAAIFRPFEQADGSVTRRHGGTGLGLPIAMQLAELMGGRLWLESKAGEGSTFYFTARFGIGEAAAAPPPAQVSLRGLPVLVVDDNATNRRILERMLLGWQMLPTVADSGRAALAACRIVQKTSNPFQLALVDCQMPEMDGFSLIEKLRGQPDCASLPVIMMTSAGQRGDSARCRTLGVAAYLTKPLRHSQLLETIAAALGASALEGASAPLVTRHSLRESRRRLRILLAEDNPVNQMVACRLLQRWGHTVRVAGNGSEALALLKQGEFDLVFMDVEMPEMDGLQAVAILRQREQDIGRHTPVIAMTAHAMKGDRERCLAAGMDSYVAKPFQAKKLLEVMEGLLGKAPAAVGEALAELPPGKAAFDKARALEYIGGSEQLLGEVAAVFLENCPRFLTEITAAIATRDAKSLERAAHTLKGSLKLFGADRAAAAAHELEQLAHADGVDGADEIRAELEVEVRRLQDVLAPIAVMKSAPGQSAASRA